MSNPMDIGSTPAYPRNLYLVTKSGQVRTVSGGQLVRTRFLDITSQTDSSGEGGLISIAFDPNFATNGRFYVYYTTATDIRYSQFTASLSGTQPVRDPNIPEVVLYHYAKPSDNEHYAGRIAIGPDGKLYGVIGDGGPEGIDPDGQDLSNPYGKILRLNTDGTIPADNPFVATAGARPEIWAYGLRNPFKFSFDDATGDLTLADVGWNTQDEIDFQPATAGDGKGDNFGWSCYEGTYFLDSTNPSCTGPAFTPPTMTISHAGLSCLSIIGGYVDHDANTPSLGGKYVYGDYCSGDVRSVMLNSSTSATGDASTGLNAFHLDTFGEDACGRLYVASFAGKVYRIRDNKVHSSTSCD